MKGLKSDLNLFFSLYPELHDLLSLIHNEAGEYWLVGGCLRNFILDVAHTDIDIASSSDPTPLAKHWASRNNGTWFWLDKQRHQSRVVIPGKLIIDFNPLRAETIEKDLVLRDFTINSLALLLDASFPDAPLLDSLGGIADLKKKQLKMCSEQSFTDDPLRILKGLRHATTLDLEFSCKTWEHLCLNAPSLEKIAGERIKEELIKILASNHVARGVQLLEKSGTLKTLLGPPSIHWDCQRVTTEITYLDCKLKSLAGIDLPGLEAIEQLTAREIILFAEILRDYAPVNCSGILHNRLRLSRQLERILTELGSTFDSTLLNVLATASDSRQQALLVEKFRPFPALKILYWGFCNDKFDLSQLKKLLYSFHTLSHHGRIPDLLNGNQVKKVLQPRSPEQISVWQSRIKLAEINREIFSSAEAEKWLKEKLPFDNEEV